MNGAKVGVGVAVALVVFDALAIRVSLTLAEETVDVAWEELVLEPLPCPALTFPGATSRHCGCATTT